MPPVNDLSSRYAASCATLAANTRVNRPSLDEPDRFYLRGIQHTWRVRLLSHLGQSSSYEHTLETIWDEDRIQGAFDFGRRRGVLMVEHGPDGLPAPWRRAGEVEGWDGEDDEDAEEEKEEDVYYDMVWRGVDRERPDVLWHGVERCRGRIRFKSCSIDGCFEGMGGFPGGMCVFDAENLFGPRRVGRELQWFIDEWNRLGPVGEEVKAREVPLRTD